MPFPAHLTYCYNCRKQKVPDVLFTTIDLPVEAIVVGKGCLIQARYMSKYFLSLVKFWRSLREFLLLKCHQTLYYKMYNLHVFWNEISL